MLLADHMIKTMFLQQQMRCYDEDGYETMPAHIGPNSVDVRLGRRFVKLVGNRRIDTGYDNLTQEWSSGEIVLPNGGFVLGCAAERFVCPDTIVQSIEGRSTMARLGLFVHACAGFGDAGFEGHFTLELLNVSGYDLTLVPGTRVAQVAFTQLSSCPDNVYSSVYKRQGPYPVPPREH